MNVKKKKNYFKENITVISKIIFKRLIFVKDYVIYKYNPIDNVKK